MTKIGALLSSSLALLVGLLGMEGASHARSMSGSMAQPVNGSQANCLAIDAALGSVRNACPAKVEILIPLPADQSGFKTVAFTGRAGSTVNGITASCHVVTNTRFGTHERPGQTSSIPTGTTFVLRTLTPSVELEPFGVLQLFCVLQHDSEILAVDFNQ